MTFKAILPIFLLMLPTLASAGRESGGGKGIVCRDNQNNIQSVELLDLWEARNLRGKTIISSSGDLETDIGAALERTRNMISPDDYRVFDSLKFTADGFLKCGYNRYSCNFLERVYGVDLPISNDSFEGVINLPSNCKIEQVATFNHIWDQRWTINMDLFDKMDTINQAAFMLHEAIYGLLDTYGWEKNSLRVRRAVGHVMSGGSFSTIPNILKKPYVQCGTPTSSGLTGDVYFTQDARTGSPKITMIVEAVRFSRLIDFNHPQLISKEVNLNTGIEEFYNNISQKTETIKIHAQGEADDIEFQSELSFEIQSGIASLFQISLTGGGPAYAPEENLKCDLVR